jgi:2-polyprenyl-6-methoxyphenol hydroxylase-like FAD-dependent oxidoreductase
VHRGDLLGVFVRECRDSDLIDLRTGSEVIGYEQEGSSTRAILRKATGTALIGADGLWSNVRKQVVGDGPPCVTGHTTYRSANRVDGRRSLLESRDALGRPRRATSSTTLCRAGKCSISS